MAVNVTGKSLGDLSEKTSLNDTDKFLCCQGNSGTTQYTTWATTFGAVSGKIANDLNARIDNKVNDAIRSGLGGYFHKSTGHQTVTTTAQFNNSVTFNGTANFAGTTKLPHNSYIRDSRGTLLEDENHRVASVAEVKNQITEIWEYLANIHEQILDIDAYSSYECPQYTNNKYWYGNVQNESDKQHTFYMYAGIRDDPDYLWDTISNWVKNHGEKSGRIVKSNSSFPGLKLTKSWRGYESLTIVYVAESDPDASQAGNNIHSVTVPVFDIELAEQYYNYKKTFHNDAPDKNRYLFYKGRTSRWYFGAAAHSSTSDNNDLYIDMEINSDDKNYNIFGDYLLPIRLSHGFYFIAVFGNPYPGQT